MSAKLAVSGKLADLMGGDRLTPNAKPTHYHTPGKDVKVMVQVMLDQNSLRYYITAG